MKDEGKSIAFIFCIAFSLIPLIISFLSVIEAYSGLCLKGWQGLGKQALEDKLILTLYGAIGCQFLGFVCIMIIAFFIDGMNFKRKWVFWVLLFYAIPWLICFPGGTFIGMSLIIYLLVYRKSFGFGSIHKPKTRSYERLNRK